MHRAIATAAAAAAVLAVPAAAAPAAHPARPVLVEDLSSGRPVTALEQVEHEDCEPLLPPATTLEHVTPSSPPVALDVLVLTEKRDLPAAKEVLSKAARAYAPLDLRLLPRFRVVRDVPELDGDGRRYLAWSKAHLGGRRPKGVDVVYLATSQVVEQDGLADYIGGVSAPEHAFAVGMLTSDGLVGIDVVGGPSVPEPPVRDGGAILAAHEIGHLLGAQHDVDACRMAPEPADPTRPCDLMFTVPKQALSLRFGPVNSAIVRDHAVRFARP